MAAGCWLRSAFPHANRDAAAGLCTSRCPGRLWREVGRPTFLRTWAANLSVSLFSGAPGCRVDGVMHLVGPEDCGRRSERVPAAGGPNPGCVRAILPMSNRFVVAHAGRRSCGPYNPLEDERDDHTDHLTGNPPDDHPTPTSTCRLGSEFPNRSFFRRPRMHTRCAKGSVNGSRCARASKPLNNLVYSRSNSCIDRGVASAVPRSNT